MNSEKNGLNNNKTELMIKPEPGSSYDYIVDMNTHNTLTLKSQIKRKQV